MKPSFRQDSREREVSQAWQANRATLLQGALVQYMPHPAWTAREGGVPRRRLGIILNYVNDMPAYVQRELTICPIDSVDPRDVAASRYGIPVEWERINASLGRDLAGSAWRLLPHQINTISIGMGEIHPVAVSQKEQHQIVFPEQTVRDVRARFLSFLDPSLSSKMDRGAVERGEPHRGMTVYAKKVCPDLEKVLGDSPVVLMSSAEFHHTTGAAIGVMRKVGGRNYRPHLHARVSANDVCPMPGYTDNVPLLFDLGTRLTWSEGKIVSPYATVSPSEQQDVFAKIGAWFHENRAHENKDAATVEERRPGRGFLGRRQPRGRLDSL